jgi:hypothetical protein
MKSYIITAAFLSASLCAPAFAQPADGAAAPAASEPAAPAEGATPKAAAAGQLVEQQFATYDLDKSGQLDATEFTAWVSKLRKPAADGAPAPDAKWSETLFARADTDQDKLVSKAEMTSLLVSAQG